MRKHLAARSKFPVSARVSREVDAQISAIAVRERRSVSAVIEILLDEALAARRRRTEKNVA